MRGPRPRSGRTACLIGVCNHVVLSNEFGTSIAIYHGPAAPRCGETASGLKDTRNKQAPHSLARLSAWRAASRYVVILASHSYETQVALQIERQEFIQSKIIDRVADEDDDLVFVEQKKKLVVDVRAKDDLELYYKTIPDYFEQDDGRKLTEIPDRTSTDMIEGRY